MNLSVAAYHTVSVKDFLLHAKIGAAMAHVRADLLEGPGVKQQGQAFTRSMLALCMLFTHRFVTSAAKHLISSLNIRLMIFHASLQEIISDTASRLEFRQARKGYVRSWDG